LGRDSLNEEYPRGKMFPFSSNLADEEPEIKQPEDKLHESDRQDDNIDDLGEDLRTHQFRIVLEWEMVI
jgi:hypothetical protein